MQIGISAIGTAVPPHKQTQVRAAEIVTQMLNLGPAETRLLKAIYKATLIESRHSVLSDYVKQPGEFSFFPNDPTQSFPTTAARMQLYQDNALTLALTAIEDCLSERKDFDKMTITHLITVSCTGMYAPGLDFEIVTALQLTSHTKRTPIGFMGCYAAFNAMDLAHDLCRADPQAKVLIVSVELCTLHFQQNSSTENIVANALFADGAAAVLIETLPQKTKALTCIGFYGDLLPQSQDKMAWTIADYGFDIVLSQYVPALIESGIMHFMEKLLHQYNLQQSDIDYYAIHPGGNKILEACETALQLDKSVNHYAYQVLARYGNMSSATILFVLKALWQDFTSKDQGKTIFSCAFGPGLTVQSMLLKVTGV